MKIEWKLESRKISQLKNWEKNPRYITDKNAEHLEKSLERFGLIEKPIVNLDGTIIGGHQRVALLKKKKVKEIDCWMPSRQLTEDEVEECNIRLNKNQGAFDFDILANQFEVLDLFKYGFSEEELVGTSFDIDEVEEEEKPSKKKTKSCPNCGHEF